jgi:hypothetical protein
MTNLSERAFAMSFDRLGSGGQMLPFALVVGHGKIECLTIVTDRSDKASFVGRRLVRQRGSGADEYAIVTDAYIRQASERLDAILVELGERGRSTAEVLAQPYRMVNGAAERLGAPVPLGSRPSELEAWDPHSLDWGPVTPDIYVEARKLAVHAVNHDFESDENVERTVRFLRARVRHHSPHLPPGTSQLIHYDDRGQSLSRASRAKLERIGDGIEVRFTSDGRG